jgi:hypothetical protein
MVGGIALWLRLVVGLEADTDTTWPFGVVHVADAAVLGAPLGAGVVAWRSDGEPRGPTVRSVGV